MRKIALLLLVLAVVLPLSTVQADPVCPGAAGCISVLEGGYILVLDGDDTNPSPAGGFISVSDDPQICSDDNGGPDDGNPANGPESTSPMCTP